MAKPIKLFESLEKVYASMGIRTSQAKLKHRVSLNYYICLLSMATYLISSMAFFIFEAKSVAEYGDSFYIVSTEAALIFHLITYIRELPRYHQLIAKFQDFFQESE